MHDGLGGGGGGVVVVITVCVMMVVVTILVVVITEKQAAIDLKNNVGHFETSVNKLTTKQLPQNVFDAMVIFSFNVGAGAFKSSTALKKLNEGDFKSACEWILPWDKITVIENGKSKKVVSEGLKNRREAEYKLCMKGVQN